MAKKPQRSLPGGIDPKRKRKCNTCEQRIYMAGAWACGYSFWNGEHRPAKADLYEGCSLYRYQKEPRRGDDHPQISRVPGFGGKHYEEV